MKINKNISFFTAIGLIAVLLIIYSLAFLPFTRGYFNDFFARIINPEIKGGYEEVQVKANENLEKDVFDEKLSLDSLGERFVKYGFARDEESMKKILADKTFYIVSPDGSSFIRRIDGEQHVEGYMATDKTLSKYRQKWLYSEANEAILGMEIVLEGEEKPLLWCLYYKRLGDEWKLYMLENE